jgi:hypothetical protein
MKETVIVSSRNSVSLTTILIFLYVQTTVSNTKKFENDISNLMTVIADLM